MKTFAQRAEPDPSCLARAWKDPAYKPTKSWAEIAALLPGNQHARDQVLAAAASRKTTSEFYSLAAMRDLRSQYMEDVR